MKQTTLLYVILLMLGTASIGLCQVTITADDFLREGNIIDAGVVANTAGVLAPTTGADQIWDYSGLTTEELDTFVYHDAAGNQYYPDALNYRSGDLTFQGFPITSSRFDDLDAQGFYEVGRSSEDVSYSITAISGGQNDSLGFVSNHAAYDGRIDYIQFPLNYQDQWNQTRIETTNFALTVAGFGLDHTPGARVRHVTQNREVAGYGQIIIPTADGSPSPPIDVLLVHVTQNQVDTFYLGGALAPAALLGAFGLTQGAMDSDEFYVFYRPGFAAPVMNFNVATAGIFYRPRAAEGVSANRNVNKTQVTCFPNPVSRGSRLTFHLEEKMDTGQIEFVDMIGRVVHKSVFTSMQNNSFYTPIPMSMVHGAYSFRILDNNGGFISSGMLTIK